MKWPIRRNCIKRRHDLVTVEREVYLMPSLHGYRAVADSAIQARLICRAFFCDYTEAWVTDDRSRRSIHSLGLPSYMMRELERDGVVAA